MKESIANRIVDFGIVFITVAGIPYNIITFFALERSENQMIRYFVPVLSVFALLLVIFKKRISYTQKVFFFNIILLLAAIFALILGLIDTAALWFMLAIIYSLLTYQKKIAMILFISAFFSSIIIGYFLVTKNPYIPIDYGFENCHWACVAVRILNFLITGFLIYYIIKLFIDTIHDYLNEATEKAVILDKLNVALKNTIDEKNKNLSLQNNIEKKNKKLMVKTLHLLKRKEYDNRIAQKIDEIAEYLDVDIKDKLLKLKNDLKISANTAFWDEFEKIFTELNETFFDNLKEEYPELTANDLKHCALVRLNMSVKDVALLLGISPRGVETTRYRLRKKFILHRNVSLYQFLKSQ